MGEVEVEAVEVEAVDDLYHWISVLDEISPQVIMMVGVLSSQVQVVLVQVALVLVAM